jgi:hypothetical protein
MQVLMELIREAGTELGSEACRHGKHLWESDGSRGCPHDDNGHCGQAVYRCTVCGAYDYGEPGGPGARDCAATSGCDYRHLQLTKGGEHAE